MDQGDVARHGDGAGDMPTRLVPQQSGVDAGYQALCEAVEEDLHEGGIGVGQHQGKGMVGAGPHGAVEPGGGWTCPFGVEGWDQSIMRP